jgi:tetratricopeptide (TPR) repeat protein
MNEEFQWNDDYHIDLLTDRFEKMISNGDQEYFDSEEFETLIDYYQTIFDNDKSRIALEIAMQQHPSSLGLRVKFARQLASEGNYQRALVMLDAIEKTEPNEAEIKMAKGSVFSMMNESDKAISELKKAVLLAEEDELEELYTSIAFEYEKLEKFDQALKYLKHALIYSPESDSLHYEIGMCFTMGHQLEDGIIFFLTQIDENPYSCSAWYNLGLAYFQLELFEKAIDAFEFVISIDDTYFAAYQSMAHAYASLEKYAKAIEVYFESFEYEKPEAMTYYYLGECYEKLNDYDNALEYYHKSIELDPQQSDPWAGIGAVYDEQGDTDNALKFTMKAIALDPSNVDLHLIAADQLIKLKEYDKAEVFFIKAEELDPNDPDVFVEYANMYVLKEEFSNAVDILRKGINQQPDNYLLYYRLGATLLFTNNMMDALFYLDFALKNDYEGHTDLLEYYPEIFNYPEVALLIEESRPIKEL